MAKRLSFFADPAKKCRFAPQVSGFRKIQVMEGTSGIISYGRQSLFSARLFYCAIGRSTASYVKHGSQYLP